MKFRTVDNTDGAVDENPRQRQRVLDKRNPLATEYSSVDDVGAVMLSDIDSEGVNSRARFPTTSSFDGPASEFSGQVSYNYNDLSGNGIVQGKAAWRRVFGKDDRWAFTLSGERTGVDHVFEAVDTRWRVREHDGGSFYLLDRVRITDDAIRTVRDRAVFTLEHRLNERHEVYLKATVEKREDEESDDRFRRIIGAGEIEDLAADSGTVRDAIAQRSVRDEEQHRKVFRVIAGGHVEGTQSRFDYSFYASRWEIDEPGNLNPVFRMEGVDYSYSLADPAFPAVTVLNDRDLFDPGGFRFVEYTVRDVLTVDTDSEFQFNYERRTVLGGLSGYFKTGAIYRTKERTNTYQQRAFDGFDGDLTLQYFTSGDEPGRVVNETYDMGPVIDPDVFRAFAASESDRFQLNMGRTRLESDTSNYRAQEKVLGTYLLQASETDRWGFQAGVRFEHTALETDGKIVLTDALGDYLSTHPVSDAGDYTRWLPGAAFNYSPGDGVRLKAAWFQTLARPDYFDLVPFRRISTNFQSITEGNPDLAPTEFDNFLVGSHLSNDAIGDLSLSFYYKQLEAFFYETEVVVSGGPFDGWDLRRKENGNGASVWGVELGWKRTWEMMGAVPGDLTLTLFYTYSESSADIDERAGKSIPLPQRSRHFFAFTANHGLGPLETEYSVTYQSRFLDGIGDDAGADVFLNDSVRMNLAFNLRLSPWVRSFVKFSNITDRPERNFEGNLSRVTNNEYNSWKIETGMRFKL